MHLATYLGNELHAQRMSVGHSTQTSHIEPNHSTPFTVWWVAWRLEVGHATLLGTVIVWNSVRDEQSCAMVILGWISRCLPSTDIFISSWTNQRSKAGGNVDAQLDLCDCGPVGLWLSFLNVGRYIPMCLFYFWVIEWASKDVAIEEDKMPFASCGGYYSQLCGDHVEWCIPQSRDWITTKRQRITTHVCHGCRTFGEWNRGLVLSVFENMLSQF